MSAEEAPTSVEIGRVLSLITRGTTEAAQQLQSKVAAHFDEVMEQISGIPEVMTAIRNFVNDAVPSDNQEAQAHLLEIIIQALKRKKRPLSSEKPVKKPGKHSPKKTEDSSEEELKEFGNENLQKFATQIKVLYRDSQNLWYKGENLGNLSQAAAHFLEEFLRFYSETYEGEDVDKTGTGTVATATKKRGKVKKKNKWEQQNDSDEDDKENTIYNSDATTLMLIFTIVHTYIEYLDRNLSVLPDQARQSDFLKSQLKDDKWGMFSVIVHALKKFLFEKEILEATREFEFSFEDNLTTLVQNWDSMGMQIEELK